MTPSEKRLSALLLEAKQDLARAHWYGIVVSLIAVLAIIACEMQK